MKRFLNNCFLKKSYSTLKPIFTIYFIHTLVKAAVDSKYKYVLFMSISFLGDNTDLVFRVWARWNMRKNPESTVICRTKGLFGKWNTYFESAFYKIENSTHINNFWKGRGNSLLREPYTYKTISHNIFWWGFNFDHYTSVK